MKLTIRNFQDFQKNFPTNEACLDYIFNNTIKKACRNCSRGQLYKVTNRKCYACSVCGKQVHPLAGTIFEKSSTPLTLWFYTIFIMAQSNDTLSAKELERHLGVTYKTAWRMSKRIRASVNKNRNKEKIINNFHSWLDLIHSPRR